MDGAMISGAYRPDALTATLISTASHVDTVSGACATIDSWATTARMPITRLFRPEAARRDSVSVSSIAHRALRARRYRAVVRLAVGLVHPVAEVPGPAATCSRLHRRR